MPFWGVEPFVSCLHLFLEESTLLEGLKEGSCKMISKPEEEVLESMSGVIHNPRLGPFICCPPMQEKCINLLHRWTIR